MSQVIRVGNFGNFDFQGLCFILVIYKKVYVCSAKVGWYWDFPFVYALDFDPLAITSIERGKWLSSASGLHDDNVYGLVGEPRGKPIIFVRDNTQR